MKNTPPKNKTLSYGLVIGIYWFTYNTMLSFSTMLYTARGFTNYELGVATTCTSLCTVAAQPIWGMICDHMPKIRKVFAIGLIGAMLATCLQFIKTENPWLIVFSICLINFCFMPLSSLNDAWITRMNANGMRINYGPTRSFGSIGGMTASLIFGFLIDRFGVVIMAPSFIICCIILLLYISNLYEPKADIAVSRKNARSGDETFGQLLKELAKNTQYILLVLCCMMSGAALGCANTFLSKKIYAFGGGFFELGVNATITAGCEIIFLVFLPYITRKLRPQAILAIGFFFVAVRILFMSLASNVVQIWLVAFLHGPSQGLMIGGVVNYLSRVVNRKSFFSAQTVYSAVSGIGSILCVYIGGVIANVLPVDTMILMMAVLPTLSFTIMGLNYLSQRKKPVPAPAE